MMGTQQGRGGRNRQIWTLIGGIALGIILGLTIGWGIWPVRWTNALPQDLAQRYKADSVQTIAEAYFSTNDEATALARLTALAGPDESPAALVQSVIADLNGASIGDREANLRRASLLYLSSVVGPVPDSGASAPSAEVAAPTATLVPVEPTQPPERADVTDGEGFFSGERVGTVALFLLALAMIVGGVIVAYRWVWGPRATQRSVFGTAPSQGTAGTRPRTSAESGAGSGAGLGGSISEGFGDGFGDGFGTGFGDGPGEAFEDEHGDGPGDGLGGVSDDFLPPAPGKVTASPPERPAAGRADYVFDDGYAENYRRRPGEPLKRDPDLDVQMPDGPVPDFEDDQPDPLREQPRRPGESRPVSRLSGLPGLSRFTDRFGDGPESRPDRPGSRPSKAFQFNPEAEGYFIAEFLAGNEAEVARSINRGRDYLGEMGMAVSKLNTGDGPFGVTALEVWLFEKSQITTHTQHLLSPHLFQSGDWDQSRLESGDPTPLLVREGLVFHLEGKDANLHCRVSEVEYSEKGPSQSVFRRLRLELVPEVK